MIMTGRSLWRIPGLSGNSYPANIADKTIPVAFNNAGYDSIRSGKAGNTYTAANVRFGQYFYHDNRDDIAEFSEADYCPEFNQWQCEEYVVEFEPIVEKTT